jgi:EAL and modified HD-GYP domain-containing signal transduction protein
MFFHAARQPILDRDKNLFAYELLFRDGITNAFPEIDGDEATSKIVAASQFDFSMSDFTGDKPAFINFTLETIVKKYPNLIPPEELVVEILETVKPGKRLLAHCKELKNLGYVIALDDYIHQPVWRHFYPFINIIKIDFLATSLETINETIEAIKDFPHIKLLAEKIETHETYQVAMDLGFEYFQGYFFSKPEMIKAKTLTPSQFSLAELLYETSKSELDLPKIIGVFELDVNLSYKLLRYSNSPLFRRRVEISTIKQAIVTLGRAELQKFVSVLFTAQTSDGKPPELMALSLTRAKFTEGLAIEYGKMNDTSIAFLTGMLSLIDAILGESMASAMEKLPLSSEIKDALVKGEGELANLIKIVKCYETTSWDDAWLELKHLGIDEAKVPDIYRNSVQWANEQMQFVLNSAL